VKRPLSLLRQPNVELWIGSLMASCRFARGAPVDAEKSCDFREIVAVSGTGGVNNLVANFWRRLTSIE
jgi:hypothetical protein